LSGKSIVKYRRSEKNALLHHQCPASRAQDAGKVRNDRQSRIISKCFSGKNQKNPENRNECNHLRRQIT
ncbi:MAG: hypothetical protein ACI406_14325, partial [Victivallis vadensis]